MGLNPNIVRAIEDLGFEHPMPIQAAAIPTLLDNDCDLVGLAQTGTGKTAAFGLPIIEKLSKSKHTEALILAPTRELCVQICNDLVNYAKYIKSCTIVAVYGGASIENQKRELQKGCKIVVATPGRLLDLVNRKFVDLSKIKTLVLDEADEMLDMGFKEELDEILFQTPASKNTLLFSATMSKEVSDIAKNYMTNPIEITVGAKNSGSDNVKHQYYVVNSRHRYDALKRIVDYYPDIYSIIFCRTKAETQEVASALMKDGYNADALHGDLSQAQRDYAMNRFRCKNLQLLVATDVAARGLDVSNLTHVINYNLPNEIEQYNHRSGRTGRANKTGISIAIVTPKEESKIKSIEKIIHKKFEQTFIPSGQEVCEKQLFHMIHKMENVNVNYDEVERFLPDIHKKLAWMDKEEIIRRFVSVEFNRFLEYYKKSPDINATSDQHHKKERQERQERFNDKDLRSIKIALGKKHHIVPQRLIGIINDYTKNKRIYIGRIDIFEDYSIIDVEAKHAGQIADIMEDAIYQGKALDVAIIKNKKKSNTQSKPFEKKKNNFSKNNDWKNKSSKK